MKSLFFLILMLVSGIAFSQPAIELKPGRTDSARWTLVRPGQTFNELTYDTIPNVIARGKVLYREGGFIGNGRIAKNSEFYTDELLQFMETQGLPMSEDRQILIGYMTGFGSSEDNLISFDTLTNRSFLGTWLVSEASCGMPNDTMIVQILENGNSSSIKVINPPFTSGETLQNIGTDVVAFLSQVFGQIVVIKKTSEDLWEGPFGCNWERID